MAGPAETLSYPFGDDKLDGGGIADLLDQGSDLAIESNRAKSLRHFD